MLRFVKELERRPLSRLLAGNNRRWLSNGSGNATKVMSFGDGSQGALGQPNAVTGIFSHSYDPSPVSGLPPNICSISAGHYHSLAVTSQGHLWSWGRNHDFQLGRPPHSPRETWNEPTRVEGLNHVKVQAAFASGVISSALGDDGSLWVWGKSKRGQLGLGKGVTESILPSRVQALASEKIVKVSLGWGHALAVTEDGKLYGWGYYADGRLGRIGKDPEASPLDSSAGELKEAQISTSALEAAEELVLEAMAKEENMPVIWEPSLIEEVDGAKVVDVACGLDHSLVLCCDGTLLSGGSNVYNQLGRVSTDFRLRPVDIEHSPASVAAGLGHSLAICRINSSEGVEGASRIVSWGWNHNSQLGREGPENIPLVVEGLVGETPVSVSGGRAHSIALTSRGEVWTWGCGRHGRLGLGSSIDEAEPMLVEYFEDAKALQVAAGFDHNLVLVAE